MGHKVYGAIIEAVKSGTLVEPCGSAEFRQACPGLGSGTYHAFLDKHGAGNPGGNSERFERVAPGRFRCLRPFKCGF